MSHPSLPFQLSSSSDELTPGTEVRIRSTKRTVVELLRLERRLLGWRVRLAANDLRASTELP